MGQMGFMSDRTRNTTSQIITQVVNKAPDYPKWFGSQNNPDRDECLAQIWPTSTVFLWPTFGLEWRRWLSEPGHRSTLYGPDVRCVVDQRKSPQLHLKWAVCQACCGSGLYQKSARGVHELCSCWVPSGPRKWTTYQSYMDQDNLPQVHLRWARWAPKQFTSSASPAHHPQPYIVTDSDCFCHSFPLIHLKWWNQHACQK